MGNAYSVNTFSTAAITGGKGVAPVCVNGERGTAFVKKADATDIIGVGDVPPVGIATGSIHGKISVELRETGSCSVVLATRTMENARFCPCFSEPGSDTLAADRENK